MRNRYICRFLQCWFNAVFFETLSSKFHLLVIANWACYSYKLLVWLNNRVYRTYSRFKLSHMLHTLIRNAHNGQHGQSNWTNASNICGSDCKKCHDSSIARAHIASLNFGILPSTGVQVVTGRACRIATHAQVHQFNLSMQSVAAQATHIAAHTHPA